MKKEEYTLHNGKKISVIYDDNNICQVTRECMEILLDLYQKGKAEGIEEFRRKFNACKETIECPYFQSDISCADCIAEQIK